MQTQETEVVDPQTETGPGRAGQATQMAELSKVAEMQAKILSGLVRAHLGSYLNQLAFAPKVKGNEKADLIIKLLDGIEGVLDLGLDVTGVQVPEKGSVGRNVATISGILAQALDNRMLLLAHKMDAAQKANEVVDLPVGSNVELNKAAEIMNKIDTLTDTVDYLSTLPALDRVNIPSALKSELVERVELAEQLMAEGKITTPEEYFKLINEGV